MIELVGVPEFRRASISYGLRWENLQSSPNRQSIPCRYLRQGPLASSWLSLVLESID